MSYSIAISVVFGRSMARMIVTYKVMNVTKASMIASNIFFLAWNRREASLVTCMMAPCTPPNSSVPTENPPILALFLGIFNGPFLKKQEQTLKL